MNARLLAILILHLTFFSSWSFAQPYYGDTLWARDYSSTGAFSCSFSPDGNSLAIAYECMGPMVRVVNVSDGLITWESATPDLCLYNIQFSSSGQYIAIAEELGHLLVIDMTIPDTVYNIDTQTGGLNAVDFSSDGTYIYAGANDGSIRVYETITGSLYHTIPSAHLDAVLSVDVSNDNHYLVSGGKDNKIAVWDLMNNYQPVYNWMDAMDDVKAVKFGPIGDKIVAGSIDDKIYVYQMSDGNLDTTLSIHMSDVNTIDISADGSFAISGSNDQSAKMINLSNYDVPFTFTNQLQTRVYGVAISPDMTKLAAANHIGYVIMYDLASLIGMEKNPEIDFQLYPNPSENIINIKPGFDAINIYNIHGELVLQNNTPGNNADVSCLIPGIYLAELQIGEHRLVERLIKK
jgi:WD40 repeat protein